MALFFSLLLLLLFFYRLACMLLVMPGLLQQLLAGLQIGCESLTVPLQGAIAQFEQSSKRLQKRLIMRDHQCTTRPLAEPLAQPASTGLIQMIARLVQDQECVTDA